MHEVAFSVLGPVEARAGGHAVALGGGRRRALLARLLLGAGAEVAVRWMAEGTAETRTEPGAYRVDHLDGRKAPVEGGETMTLTGRPVLIRLRPG